MRKPYIALEPKTNQILFKAEKLRCAQSNSRGKSTLKKHKKVTKKSKSHVQKEIRESKLRHRALFFRSNLTLG